jgi:predicted aspartyl protease
MLVLDSFDASGSPVTTIQVVGSDGTTTTYQATIDTGFTGFVALNKTENEHLIINLQILGVTPVILGDGSAKDSPFAVAQVTLGRETRGGAVIFDDNSHDVLIGLDFLRQPSSSLRQW